VSVTEDRMRITWDRALETGEEEIDAQHRELFARIDKLLAASREKRSREEVGQMLTFLTFLGDYVVHHFSAEERMMMAASYTELAAHQAEHARFVQEFTILYNEYKTEGPSTLFIIRVGNRVTGWLREHIYRTDRSLVQWLRQHQH
jgi:hemerythrin